MAKSKKSKKSLTPGKLKKLLDEGHLPMIADKKIRFTRLILDKGSNGMEVSVVGGIDEFWHAINNVHKDSLLKG
jgi:hypothetical protein